MSLSAALTETAIGIPRYVFRAWLVAFGPSLALFGLRVLAGGAVPGGGMPSGVAGFAAYSILGAPLIETGLMLPVAALLRRMSWHRWWLPVVLLAALAAAAHGFAGTAWSAAAAFWPFVVYAATLFAWWRHSWATAFLVAAAVHALYNASFFAVFVAGRLAA
jgi:hypothetical protein